MSTLSLLTESTCVEVRGADAGTFLHAQLSQTIVSGAAASAPLAGWLDARGRVRALLRVWPLPDRWLLATPRDGVDDLLKRLRMFVLRSAVTLRVADDFALAALLDATPDSLAARGLPPTAAPGTVIARGELHWLCVGCRLLAGAGPERCRRSARTRNAHRPRPRWPRFGSGCRPSLRRSSTVSSRRC